MNDFKDHAGEFAAVMLEALGHVEVQDRNALVQGVFFFPWRGFHFFKAAADDDLDIFSAQTFGRPAAVHSGVTAAQHNHTLAYAVDMTKRDRGQPVNADMNVGSRLLAARHLKVASPWCATANKNGIKVLRHQGFQGIDPLATLEFHTQVQDITRFLVNHRFRQSEAGDL